MSELRKARAYSGITARSTFDALYRNLKKPSAAPQATVEAIMVAVLERGLAALKDAANVERLSRCDLSAAKEGAAAAMTQLPDWTNRLLQERPLTIRPSLGGFLRRI